MKKTTHSSAPHHVEGRKLYSQKLRLTNVGAWITQSIELCNSTYLVYALAITVVPQFYLAAVIIAFAFSFFVQMAIRVNLMFLGKLKGDQIKDEFQRSEIKESLILGVGFSFIALCMTFTASYMMVTKVTAFEYSDVEAIHAKHNEASAKTNETYNLLIVSENETNKTIVSEIENKYNSRVQSAKTAPDKEYLLKQKSKAIDKELKRHSATVSAISDKQAAASGTSETNRTAELIDAKAANGAKQNKENSNNNKSFYGLFALSFVLIVGGGYLMYCNGKYVEKCGIEYVDTTESNDSYSLFGAVKRLLKEVFKNRIIQVIINITDYIGVDYIQDKKQQPKTSNKKASSNAVFTAPAEIEQPKETETPQTEQPKQIETNVVEFDLKKADVVVEQQNTQNKTDFELSCKSYLNGVVVNKSVEDLMVKYATGNGLDLGARRSGITTALKRFYEYSARANKTSTPQEAQKLKKMIALQTENILANGLYILSNGGCIESGVHDNGLFFVTVKLKRK